MTADTGDGPAEAGPVVAAHRLCVEYDGIHAVEDVDLTIGPGEFVALLGANGSGKTTLIRALLGLQPISHGQALLFGSPLAQFRDWSRIALVPQRLPGASAVPISVWETVLSGQISPRTRLRRFTSAQRVAAGSALAAVGLADRRHSRLDTLSGGQQRRVLIARALATGADLYVLDEPTAGIDAASQQRLAASLEPLARQGRTVILVTHELGPLAPLVTRAVVLGRGSRGSIEYDGPAPPPAHLEGVVHHHADDVEQELPPPVTGVLEA